MLWTDSIFQLLVRPRTPNPPPFYITSSFFFFILSSPPSRIASLPLQIFQTTRPQSACMVILVNGMTLTQQYEFAALTWFLLDFFSTLSYTLFSLSRYIVAFCTAFQIMFQSTAKYPPTPTNQLVPTQQLSSSNSNNKQTGRDGTTGWDWVEWRNPLWYYINVVMWSETRVVVLHDDWLLLRWRLKGAEI